MGARRRECRSASAQAPEPLSPRRDHRRRHRDRARHRRRGAGGCDPAGGPGAANTHGRHGAGAADRRRHAADRLRQRHRARQQKIHERGCRAVRAAGGAGDPVRAELRHRRRARAADGGHARRARRRARRRPGAGDRLRQLPALPFDRHARRRDRRRHQERAGHRRRRRRRPRPGRQRRSGTDDARLRRAGAVRQGLWRQARDHDGAVGPRRPDPHLLEPAIAQLQFRHASRPRPKTARDSWRPGRRRLHRVGAGRDGAGARGRHADLGRGRRAARRRRSASTKRSSRCLSRPFKAEG